MKIIVFGATGGIGKLLLPLLSTGDHQVTRFSRNLESLHPNNHIQNKHGNVTNYLDVKEGIQNHDLVICLLGAPLQDKSLIRTIGTNNIVKAMKETGVKRILCLSSFGVGSSFPFLPFLYRWVLGPILLRNLFKDHLGQEKLITESGLDFTIIRPGNFFDGPLTNQYLHGRTEDIPKYKLAYKISKADLVDFILKQINSNQYNREVTWISNER
ncbi:NAD(P)-dependent oxidoreductase [Leptospira vanthielii]|uniref:NADH(P)-binding protein, PF13460 family n=1 Tax=Leptospira vanthielii serovar Holland str. Waz Holland = ATCC 700522 TaxID=1218591 RepID=N1WDK6_9LEPT|nr:NAD(P)H-binding protein [Leptospira vanthielii]EMY69961.1 NADH(P)-binding protein, PF13460 family [Leptospira vanthielii serovar Holland str. Waz Holland = ATCC 700522]